jgi:hypothetical protein
VSGIEGAFVSTSRATISALSQPGSTSEMRAHAARTAINLAARVEPTAILNVFVKGFYARD